jgi:ABC-type multidrug transport system ATPase subunit
MSGLDPLGYKETRDIILELNRRGKTVFFNTHILSEVEKTCDRVAVLPRGRIVSVKAVNDVMKKLRINGENFVKTVTAVLHEKNNCGCGLYI